MLDTNPRRITRRKVVLKSLRNLKTMVLHRFDFPRYSIAEEFVWPKLRRLHFDDSVAIEDQLSSFMSLHSSTLRDLSFSGGFFYGHWANALDVMHQSLELESFCFSSIPMEFLSVGGVRQKYI